MQCLSPGRASYTVGKKIQSTICPCNYVLSPTGVLSPVQHMEAVALFPQSLQFKLDRQHSEYKMCSITRDWKVQSQE